MVDPPSTMRIFPWGSFQGPASHPPHHVTRGVNVATATSAPRTDSAVYAVFASLESIRRNGLNSSIVSSVRRCAWISLSFRG